MPFVSFGQIIPFISPAVQAAIISAGTFKELEQQTAELISSMTGYEIPESSDDSYSWVIKYSAWLIEHLALPLMNGLSELETQRITGNYKQALKELDNYKTTGSTATDATSGAGRNEMEDLW